MQPFWYSYTLTAWRERVAKMSDGELDSTRAAIVAAVEACTAKRAWDAEFANQRKLKIVLAERDRRRDVGQYVPMRPRPRAWR